MVQQSSALEVAWKGSQNQSGTCCYCLLGVSSWWRERERPRQPDRFERDALPDHRDRSFGVKEASFFDWASAGVSGVEFVTQDPNSAPSSFASQNGSLSPQAVNGRSGFPCTEDVEAIRVEECHISPFSLPQEVLTFQPSPEEVATIYPGGRRERLIHSNIELDPDELEQVRSLQRICWDEKVKVSPTMAVSSSRYLNHSRGDLRIALKNMTETDLWRREHFRDGPMTGRSIMEALSYGVCYFVGRDSALRPAMMMRPGRIPHSWSRDPQLTELLRSLVFCMEYFLHYLVVPGRVESMVVITDFSGINPLTFPVKSLINIQKVVSLIYVGRVYRVYLCNLPVMLRGVVNAAKLLMSERQRQKLYAIEGQGMESEFALHQLETDVGGTRPCLTQFFPWSLEPGPFTAGWRGGPNPDAVQGVHEVLTDEGFLGRLWSSNLSREANEALVYSDRADAIFAKCKIPRPRSLTEQTQTLREASEFDQKASESSPAVRHPAEASRELLVPSHGDIVDDEDAVGCDISCRIPGLTCHATSSSLFSPKGPCF